MAEKVVIIGLDGGTYDLLKPLVAEGVMPRLGEWLGGAAWGELEAMFPPMTGPSWVSLMTGKNPGKHSVFDFFEHYSALDARKISSYNSINAETLWSVAGRLDKKVGVFNVPITYPPPEINGFLVSGMLSPGMDESFTYPPELREELESRYGRFILDIPWQKYNHDSVKQFIEALSSSTRQKGQYAVHLMENCEWDLFMAVINDTDSIQHALWRMLAGELGDRLIGYRDMALDYFRELDSVLGDMLRRVGKETRVFLVSDHGFGPLDKRFHLNTWLHEEGFLSIDWKKYKKKKTMRSLGSPVLNMMHKTGLNLKISRQKKTLGSRLYRGSFLHCVDWANTRAFSGLRTEQGIYINLEGRQEGGTVKSGEYEELREEIIERLQNFMDSDCGVRYPSIVKKREDAYDGPFVKYAPDIVFLLQNGRCQADDIISKDVFESGEWRIGTGTHRMGGIIGARGPGIKAGAVSGASIVDIMPTVLYSLGLAVPDDLDGFVLSSLFTEEFASSNPINYMGGGQGQKEAPKGGTGFTSEEEEKVVERLKGLGYLD